MLEIEIRDLSARWPGIDLFDGLDLSLRQANTGEGTVLGIVGRSGTGKSTLGNIVLGVTRPVRGAVIRRPENLRAASVPQQAVLFDHLNLRENLLLPFQGKDRADAEAEIPPLAELLGLTEVLTSDRSIRALSGGEAQRLSLIRALLGKPDILVLDEPCTGLDTVSRNRFLAALRLLVTERPVLALYISHHAEEALAVSDSMIALSRRSGITLAAGPATAEVLVTSDLEACVLLEGPNRYVADVGNLPPQMRRGLVAGARSVAFHTRLITREGAAAFGLQTISEGDQWVILREATTGQDLLISRSGSKPLGAEILMYDGSGRGLPKGYTNQ